MTPFRRGSCGHYIIASSEPAGYDAETGRPVYLCDECVERAHGPKLETKAVGLGALSFTARKSPDMEPVATIAARMTDDPHEQGAFTAVGGGSEEECPHPDKQSKEAAEWLRGFREAAAPSG